MMTLQLHLLMLSIYRRCAGVLSIEAISELDMFRSGKHLLLRLA